MAFTNINEEEVVGKGVYGLADTPELSTEAMQTRFDNYSWLLKDKFNNHIEELEAEAAAADIGMSIPESLTNVTDKKAQPIINEIASRVNTGHTWNTTAESNGGAAIIGATIPTSLQDEVSTEKVQPIIDEIAARVQTQKEWIDGTADSFETDDLKTGAFHATDTEVTAPTVTYTDRSNKVATTEYVQENMQQASMGDMRKAVYDTNNNGYVDQAEKLHTARSVKVNLASTTAANFDGSSNITPGVDGVLPATNGGTGYSTLADLKAGMSLNNVNNTSDADKPVSTATQTALDGKAPTSHAATATTYGKGDSTNYGHVQLSDSTSSTSNSAGGVAATPKAVKSVNDIATPALTNEASVENGDTATSQHSAGEYIVYGSGHQFAKVNGAINVGDAFESGTGGNVTNKNIGEVLTELNSALMTLFPTDTLQNVYTSSDYGNVSNVTYTATENCLLYVQVYQQTSRTSQVSVKRNNTVMYAQRYYYTGSSISCANSYHVPMKKGDILSFDADTIPGQTQGVYLVISKYI
jgi:hypothetical protein